MLSVMQGKLQLKYKMFAIHIIVYIAVDKFRKFLIHLKMPRLREILIRKTSITKIKH